MTQKIESGRIAEGAVLGNKIAPNAVRGNNIVAGTITGNLIGTNSVSSNTLAANLTISLSRAIEEANISTVALSGVYTIHVANNGVYMFDANTTGNVTFNLRANTQNAFDSFLGVGETASIAIGVRHGTVRHEANLQIDGNAQTLFYVGNTRPANVSISRQEYNIFSYTVFKTGANAYIVLAANTLFATG